MQSLPVQSRLFELEHRCMERELVDVSQYTSSYKKKKKPTSEPTSWCDLNNLSSQTTGVMYWISRLSDLLGVLIN